MEILSFPVNVLQAADCPMHMWRRIHILIQLRSEIQLTNTKKHHLESVYIILYLYSPIEITSYN